MDTETFWLAGNGNPAGTWTIIGLYETKEEALAHCEKADDFVGPYTPDFYLLTEDWDVEYPLAPQEAPILGHWSGPVIALTPKNFVSVHAVPEVTGTTESGLPIFDNKVQTYEITLRLDSRDDYLGFLNGKPIRFYE
jgi:hypothetical protein